MAKTVYEKYDGREVTDDMLQRASELFSENYGIWGEKAANMAGKFAKEGSRVKISKDRLRAQYLPSGAICSYVRVTIDDGLAGNAFACRWRYKEKSVCWITQLVVHRAYRERGLAMGLLNELRQDDDGFYGLMSSHPAACLAAAKVFGSGDTINAVQPGVIRDHAESIIKLSPITYVKDAKLRGTFFNPADPANLVSCVCTNFFVDHTEPLEALKRIRGNTDWPLGDLVDGHEFILIVAAKHRARPTTRYYSASN